MALSFDPPPVGRSIRMHRERRGLTLRGLAARLEVSAGTLSAIENGTTSLSVERLCGIAQELDLPPQALLVLPDEGGRAPASASAGARGDWREFAELTVDPALRGAMIVFCRKGFHGASIREIADAAALSVPGLYHYHPSKLAMLVALLDLTMDDLTWRLEAVRAGVTDDVERLRITVECLALFHARRPGPAFVGASEMRSFEPGEDKDRIVLSRKRIQQMLYDDIAALVGDLPDAGTRVVMLGNAISTMCTSVAQWFDPDGAVDADRLAVLYADAAVAMCACPPAHDHGRARARKNPVPEGKAS